ncbi:MAG: hypothetical protein Q9185_002474 [Variospora sp. 1 TL-2023]
MARFLFHHLTNFLLLILLLPTISALPQCSLHFGHPDYASCDLLLHGARDYATGVIITEGIDRIDRRDHLFHINPTNLHGPPPGVSATQFRWVLPLPQPEYPESWRESNPGMEAPAPSRTLAEIGSGINTACVWGGWMGGMEFAGTNGRMVLVLYQPRSEFDDRMKAISAGGLAYLDEAEVWEEESENEDAGPRDAKRVKIDRGSGAAISMGVGGLYSITQAISADIGSGWLMQYNAVKSILPVVEAARQLVAFYDFVVEEASARIKTGAEELKKLAFTLGDVSLVLNGTDVIHWDWIIDFAMSMEDGTNAGNPIQYASTVASTWQQNTIKAQLFLDGVAAG